MMNHDQRNLEAHLEETFSGGAIGPPGEFMRRVAARRRRVIASRFAAVAVPALLAVAAVLLARGPAPSRSLVPGDGGAVLVQDRTISGRGLNAPGPGWAPAIRAGDDPDSQVIRDLLST